MQIYGFILLTSVTKGAFAYSDWVGDFPANASLEVVYPTRPTGPSITYSDFVADSANDEECAACTRVETTTVKEIRDCLDRVPDTCLYTMKATSTENRVNPLMEWNCSATIGAELIKVNFDLQVAPITAMGGTATAYLWKDKEEKGYCELDVYQTDDVSKHCKATGDGNIVETITFEMTSVWSTMKGTMNLSKYTKRYIDFFPTEGSTCYTTLRTLALDEGGWLRVALRGTAQSTPSPPLWTWPVGGRTWPAERFTPPVGGRTWPIGGRTWPIGGRTWPAGREASPVKLSLPVLLPISLTFLFLADDF